MKAKTKAPALSYYFNTLENRPVDSGSPFKRRSLLESFHDHPEKTEFGIAQGGPRSPYERHGGHGVHPGRRTLIAGTLDRRCPRRTR